MRILPPPKRRPPGKPEGQPPISNPLTKQIETETSGARDRLGTLLADLDAALTARPFVDLDLVDAPLRRLVEFGMCSRDETIREATVAALAIRWSHYGLDLDYLMGPVLGWFDYCRRVARHERLPTPGRWWVVEVTRVARAGGEG